MEKLFIPHKTGVPTLAKEKGFDEPCLAKYDNNGDFGMILNRSSITGQVAAPTYDQIVNWFIEKHNIHPNYGSNHSGWYWVVTKTNGTTIKEQSDCNYFKTHYEALTESIKEAFKLI